MGRSVLGMLASGCLGLGVVQFACSSPDHPPLVGSVLTNTGGAGGRSTASGGAKSTGTSGGASTKGDGGATATGGKGGGTIPGGATKLDPSEVYLLGTLSVEQLGFGALAHWSTPNTYSAGFPAIVNNLQLLGTDLLYLSSTEEIRKYVPDLVSSDKLSAVEYPKSALANDPILDTPPCSPDTAGPKQFFTGPEGDLIYLCPDFTWYADGEALVPETQAMLALGYDRLALIISTASDLSVLDLKDGTRTRVDMASALPLAVRSTPGGFFVATYQSSPDQVELWEVSADGSATELGEYPAPPGESQTGFAAALNADNELFQIGIKTQASQTVVVLKRTLKGDAAMIYDGGTAPNVKMSGIPSLLLTGP